MDPATFEPDATFKVEPPIDTKQNIAEWVIVVCAAILVVLTFKAYVFQAFWIPSASMEPTLMVGDRIVVDKLSYRFGDVKRGDIVVFDRPPIETNTSIKHLVKRVIGLPGDTIEAHKGVLYRNKQLVSEKYLPPGTITIDLPPTQVPKGQVWLMGDNRTGSEDSRVFGAVDQDLIVGKTVFRFWPLNEFGRI